MSSIAVYFKNKRVEKNISSTVKEFLDSGRFIHIYVCGPFRGENETIVFNNMRRGMRYATILMLLGFVPFCPWLDHELLFQLRGKEWLSRKQLLFFTMSWIFKCQALLVLPGFEKSFGTRCEKKLAEMLGIPIFHSIEKLCKYFNIEKTERYLSMISDGLNVHLLEIERSI